jgi:formylglycine-generating enzyme required for sulfatase activity
MEQLIKELLIGAGGDYLGGLAASISGQLLKAAGSRIAKKFKPEPQQMALNKALALALHKTGQGLGLKNDALYHFAKVFGVWLEREAVANELFLLIDPQPDDEISIDILWQEFMQIGFAAEKQAAELDFDHVVGAFIRHFTSAAAAQPELQNQIQIGLLREVTAKLSEQTSLFIDIKDVLEKVPPSVKSVEDAVGKIGDDIVDRLGSKQSDLHRDYLRQIVNRTGDLDLSPFDTDSADTKTGQNMLVLTDVYIGLNLKGAGEKDSRLMASKGRIESTDKPQTVLETFGKHAKMILLGEPGGGKTTFVRYLSHCLSGYQCGDRGLEKKLLGEGWPREKLDLVPVPVILRDLEAWLGKDPKPTAEKAALFIDYLAHVLKEWNLVGFEDRLAELIRKGRAVIFLDGLDEVVTDPKTRKRVISMIKALPDVIGAGSIMVTCRVLSFKEDETLHLGADWRSGELDQFTDKQVDRFLMAWFQCRKDCRLEAVPDNVCRELQQAVRRPGLKELYRKPLLLTVMAIVHTKKGRLPEASVQLYEEIVDILLSRWDQKKSDDDAKGLPKLTDLLDEAKTDTTKLLKALSRVTFNAHKQYGEGNIDSDDGQQTAQISAAALKTALKSLHPDYKQHPATGEDDKWAARVVYLMKYRAGLLIERTDGFFYFPHRIFQEYLAAYHLTSGDFVNTVLGLQVDRQAWRVVVLLAVDRQVQIFGNNFLPLQLAQKLLQKAGAASLDDSHGRYAWLAGECLLKIGVKETLDEAFGSQTIAKTKTALENIFQQERLSPRERAEAADVLGALDDTRAGVGVKDGLLDIEWHPISKGPFLMGSDPKQDNEAREDEHPQFKCSLIHRDFQISRYPITVGQYRCFIDTGGYGQKKFWTKAGWQWRCDGDILKPVAYSGVFGLPNHPQVGVSWYEAVAFCNWLSDQLGKRIGLPTEAQWERAARHTDGRIYPWRHEYQAGCCNVNDAGIDSTSAVGIFPVDTAECGAMDMAGNVWEWCCSKWQENYDDYEKSVDDDLEGDDTRVLRGGCWGGSRGVARCADRLRDRPSDRDGSVGFRCVRT